MIKAFINIGESTKQHPESLTQLGYEIDVQSIPDPDSKTGTKQVAYVEVNGFLEPTAKASITRAYRKDGEKVTQQVEVDVVDFSTEELKEAAIEKMVGENFAIRYSNYVKFPNGKVLNSSFAASQLSELGCLVMHDPNNTNRKNTSENAKAMSSLAKKLAAKYGKKADDSDE